MAKLRKDGFKVLGGKKVVKIRDVQQSIVFDPANPSKTEKLNLPKSNVLQFFLEGGTVVSARPSGTEPKIKFYINAQVPVKGGLDAAKKEASALCASIKSEINAVLDAAN